MIYNYLLYKLESSKRKAKELVGSKTSRSFQDRDYIATIISCQIFLALDMYQYFRM
jgi:hypothetical protein